MKIKLGISTIILAALCGTLHAADQSTTTVDSQNQWQYDRHLGKPERADKIIGREIKDGQDQSIGRVKDLAVDLQNGRIVEVIVGTGGVLGVDERYVAVPPGDFQYDASTKTLQLINADKTKLAEAPEFKLSQWESNVGQPSVTAVYRYYGMNPYFAAEARPEHAAETGIQLGQVERADKIIGTTVHNMQNERLGKVDDMVIDLHSGRVVEVILSSGGFLGIDNELSAVPPQSFHQGTEPDSLALDTSKDALMNAPHFKSSEWPNLDDQQYISGVYHSYNVPAYFETYSADNTARNAVDRTGNSLTPLNQGESKEDIAITREIRRQIMATSGLSVNAQNVKIITLDGRVTLRGTVNTSEEKHTLDDIAAKVTNQGNVNDQLMVANNPSASN